MALGMRDGYSDFAVFQAVLPTAALDATTNGADRDTRGYKQWTCVVNVGRLSLISDASHWQLRLQHTDASALGLGPSTYADCGSLDMVGPSGAITSGVFKSLYLSTMGSTAYVVGYRGDKRYFRVVIEKVLTPSYAQAGAVYVGQIPDFSPANSIDMD